MNNTLTNVVIMPHVQWNNTTEEEILAAAHAATRVIAPDVQSAKTYVETKADNIEWSVLDTLPEVKALGESWQAFLPGTDPMLSSFLTPIEYRGDDTPTSGEVVLVFISKNETDVVQEFLAADIPTAKKQARELFEIARFYQSKNPEYDYQGTKKHEDRTVHVYLKTLPLI